MVDEPTRAAGEEPFDRPGEPPQFVGPFRLLERIGSGGMGVVHLAERREPVAQRVALKVIRTDRLDRTYRARFAMEQDALARMDHPNIARLLDAGDSNGQSWFAMEFVPGQPLTDYCREHRLSVEQRLRLFVQICDGVQHAHIKGILHRDLKPGNILVREVDGRPVAKIIDFGLAQPVDPLQIRATLHEAVQQVVGTFAYMSPEQATRTEGDLDTRTDVYSLGAVLYELLTGELPLDLDDVKKRGLAWFGTFLREHEPPKPSTRLSALGERLPSTAAERATSPARLQSSVRGDLDWVTMKALARDRQRRYPTVRELGREVERVLAHRPVEAGPPGAWYVARKWVRRHAVGVSVAGVLLGGSLAAAVVIDGFAAQAQAAEARRDLVARGLLVAEHVRRAEEDLWPADGSRVADLAAWLAELPSLSGTAAQLVAYEREVAGAAASGADAAAGAQLALVRRGLAACAELEGMRQRVEQRLLRARTLAARTIDAYEDAWRGAQAATEADPRFEGFRLPRLAGLVPLGRNLHSGLQEFYLLDSAADVVLPVRGPDETYVVGPGTGLIFVLVPGASFRMPNQLSGARGREQTYALQPFLLSRYEMTQAQWARMLGEGVEGPRALAQHNIANEPDGLQRVAGGPGEAGRSEESDSWHPVTWIHPMQQVDWVRAERGLRRWGLALPTSAQWSCAASACAGGVADFAWLGSETGRWVNFADRARMAAASGSVPRPEPVADDWDGFVHTSPVGVLAPNPFGFHDVFGNVAELCRDGYRDDTRAVGATNGDVPVARQAGRAVHHGYAFTTRWPVEHLAKATQVPIGNIHEAVGLRPVFVFDR